MQIIDKDKLLNSDLFTEYNSAIICGKGPTYKPIEHPINNTLCISINDAFNISNHTDMLVFNDIEFLDRIKLNKLTKLKFILSPIYPHKDRSPNEHITYDSYVIPKIINHFSGCFIPYNLHKNTYNPNFIKLEKPFTSSNTASKFIGEFLPNIQNITLYGVGISNSFRYAKCFPNRGSGGYKEDKNHILKTIRKGVEKDLHDRNIKFL